jgi:hypothetical protein
MAPLRRQSDKLRRIQIDTDNGKVGVLFLATHVQHFAGEVRDKATIRNLALHESPTFEIKAPF